MPSLAKMSLPYILARKWPKACHIRGIVIIAKMNAIKINLRICHLIDASGYLPNQESHLHNIIVRAYIIKKKNDVTPQAKSVRSETLQFIYM